MKKTYAVLSISTLVFLFTSFSFGQSTFPQGFNYQAIARNATGAAITNTNLKVKIGLLSDTITNILVWEEEHSVTTNGYGLFSLVVGGPKGTRTGGSAATFRSIDWAASQMFIFVQIKNPATATLYTPMGKAKLWSVPYALLADKAQKDISSQFLSNGDTVYLTRNFAVGSDAPHRAQLAVVSENDDSDDPLFEVRRKDGQPVFTVYNDAVSINVPYNGKKGSPSRGGFAVGGFDASKGTYVTDLFRVTPDSIRMYINNNPVITKNSPSRGGFAVGGFDESKAKHTEIMRVTYDSTRIYTSNPAKGFGVGQIGAAIPDNYMFLTPDNYFIGHRSGRAITTGKFNTFIGYQAGQANTSGNLNAFIGYNAGLMNATGSSNIFIGTESGGANTSGLNNVFLGDFAGTNNNGNNNVFLGNDSGNKNTTGSNNVFIGNSSGFASTTGEENIYLGNASGQNNTTGSINIFIGQRAGFSNTTGLNNLAIGYLSGESNQAATNQFFLGNWSGQKLTDPASFGNTFIGHESGTNTTYSKNNTFIGFSSGKNNPVGENNTYVGASAGRGNGVSGSDNVVIGSEAGENLSGGQNVMIGRGAGIANTGSGNIFIGHSAGASIPTGDGASNMLIIDNSTNANSLVWGDLSTRRIVINGNATTDANAYVFYANGASGGSTPWASASDLRLKTNVVTIQSALSKVMQLRGVDFEWKDPGTHEEGTRMGLIAQEVEPIVPEVVSKSGNYYTIEYAPMTALLIQAIKEQQATIDALTERIRKLEEIIDKLTDK